MHARSSRSRRQQLLSDLAIANVRYQPPYINIGTRSQSANGMLHQQPNGTGKIYSLHEPQVDCISKGKARVRYEFGTKVSVAATIDEGFILGMRARPGNPYDDHTLAEALEQVEILTGRRPSLAVVDRGYRGHGVETTRALISSIRRGGKLNGIDPQA